MNLIEHDAVEAHSCRDHVTSLLILYAVDKDLRVKTSCSRSIATSCVLLKKLLSTNLTILDTISNIVILLPIIVMHAKMQ